MTIDEALKRLDDYDYTQRGVLEDVYRQGRADAMKEVFERIKIILEREKDFVVKEPLFDLRMFVRKLMEEQKNERDN